MLIESSVAINTDKKVVRFHIRELFIISILAEENEPEGDYLWKTQKGGGQCTWKSRTSSREIG